MAELTDEQIANEEVFLEGLPRMNIGAFLMPGIWGPAHGFWPCILFYPIYLFLDNLLFSAYVDPQPFAIALALIVLVLFVVVSVAFSLVSQPIAAHRADAKGVSRERYLRRERIWTAVSIVLAIAALAWATYYNLNIRVIS